MRTCMIQRSQGFSSMKTQPSSSSMPWSASRRANQTRELRMGPPQPNRRKCLYLMETRERGYCTCRNRYRPARGRCSYFALNHFGKVHDV